MRRTSGAVSVARALLADPGGTHYGWDLRTTSGQRSATVYRVLSRMLAEGWLADGWEDPSTTGGRPARRYYRVTEFGLTELRNMVDADH